MEDQRENPNITQLEERWRGIKGSYRRAYPSLREGDMTYRVGEFDNMTERIAKRTNRSRDQVMAEIRNWELDRAYKEKEESARPGVGAPSTPRMGFF